MSLNEVKCSIGSRDDLGRPITSALENKRMKIPQLRIVATSFCGGKCLYCRPTGEGNDCGDGNKFIDVGKALEICQLYREMGGTEVKITGGDPVFWPELVQFVKCLKSDLIFQKVEVITRSPKILGIVNDLVDAGMDVLNFSLDATDKDILFLVGSAISYDKPSPLPLGNELTEFVLKRVCGDYKIKKILEMWKVASCQIRNYNSALAFSFPRLETICGCIHGMDKAMKREYFLKGFSSYAKIPYDYNHYILSSLCSWNEKSLDCQTDYFMI